MTLSEYYRRKRERLSRKMEQLDRKEAIALAREAHHAETIARDLEGVPGHFAHGLNFYKLFWMFFICCFLGVVVETVFHRLGSHFPIRIILILLQVLAQPEQILHIFSIRSNTITDFMKEIISSVAKNFNAGEPADLELMLPESLKKELEPFVRKELSAILGSKVNATFSKKINGGFTIGPADGGYFISLTDETFRELISGYLRPATKKLLFG